VQFAIGPAIIKSESQDTSARVNATTLHLVTVDIAGACLLAAWHGADSFEEPTGRS
jgi:hypothetical protein